MMFSLGILEILIILALVGVPAVIVILLIAAAGRRSGTSGSDNPNLRPCPDCGRAVSVRASVRPQCGGPLKGVV